MATNINTLKGWFTTGKFPTQAQFWAWLDSYRHNDESIPVNEIDGLNGLLNLKADAEALSNHINDLNAHAALFAGKADLVAGKVPASQLPDVINGTANRIPRFSTSNTLEASSLLFDDGTRIGVGANSTGGRFEVRAQGALSSDVPFSIRNSANNQNLLKVNGVGNLIFGDVAYDAMISMRATQNEIVDIRENNGFNSVFKIYGNTVKIGLGAGRLSNNNSNINFGYTAGYNNTGLYNVFLGSNAGYNNSTGERNIFIGSNAGFNNNTGGSSLFIGDNAQPQLNNQLNQIVIGFEAIGDGSNSVVLGNSSITRTKLQGQVLVGQFSTAPTGIVGAIYYNTVEKKHYGFNGATWNAFY